MIYNPRRELILPEGGGTSTWVRGENLAAPSLNGPQPISHYPVGLGFPHPEGRYRPEGSTFSSPGCWLCRDVEGFLTRGNCKLYSPGVAGSQRWPEGKLSPRAGSEGPSQSSITRWRWGFHTLRGGIDQGDLSFPPRLIHVIKIPKNI